MQVPLIIRWPGKLEAGSVSEDLFTTIDISKTILDIIGANPAQPLHGRNLFDGTTKNRKYVFAARDKMDSTYDACRAIRSKQFKLIQNLMPERPCLQYNKYKEDSYPTLAEMNVLYLKGELNDDQSKFMVTSKPEFELYDIINDPYELNNLADHQDYKEIKKEYIAELQNWRSMVQDKGIRNEFRTGGWPVTYPTRTLEEWKDRRDGFKPWVFRSPTEKNETPIFKVVMKHDNINKKIKKYDF